VTTFKKLVFSKRWQSGHRRSCRPVKSQKSAQGQNRSISRLLNRRQLPIRIVFT
jgi:hypothetical protein